MRRTIAVATVALVLTSCGNWRGIANVPLPGGPGAGADRMTIYVQIPDTLALNVNSRVRVADVYVGRVRAIELEDWVATLTLDLQPDVRLPSNATAAVGQTSLLGSQHIELAAPPDPSPDPLRSGDTIALRNASAYPTAERTLAGIATVLRGGGIPSLEVIQNEVNNIVSGNAEQIRDFLGKLAVFTGALDDQRHDIIRALDSTNRLLATTAHRNDTLDQVLTEFPPLIEHFADTRERFADAVEALGDLSGVVTEALAQSRTDFDQNLRLLQRPLRQLGRSSPYLLGALKLMLTLPFNIDDVPKVVRGDYVNISGTFDLTLSSLDNAVLTGTGFSGALRALEQAWGRDPQTMIPDIRYTPNPNSAPNGPLVERGE